MTLLTPLPMNSLADMLASLVRYHIATHAAPLPEPTNGITWIWAANGIFKRACDATLDALILVQPLAQPTPGLAQLLPHVRWRQYPERLPGWLLTAILVHAKKASTGANDLVIPIEQQYHLVLDRGQVQVRTPPQQAAPSFVRYEMPHGAVLLDLHSHHIMQAYFSATDDRDDQGLSVSAVIGRIFGPVPEIAVRVNLHGHRSTIPATLIFDGLGPFHDTYGGP